MQGKLIAVEYKLKPVLSGRNIKNKNRCISVCLVSVEDKSIEF